MIIPTKVLLFVSKFHLIYLFLYSCSDLISTSLVFNILCLLYVKVILNESKPDSKPEIESKPEIIADELDITSIRSNGKGSSKGSTSRKHTKRKQLAKAFSLDVIWDYILIIFKKRAQYGRLVIILFLTIVLIEKTSPYGTLWLPRLHFLRCLIIHFTYVTKVGLPPLMLVSLANIDFSETASR